MSENRLETIQTILSQQGGMRLTELSAASGIPTSTLHRLLMSNPDRFQKDKQIWRVVFSQPELWPYRYFDIVSRFENKELVARLDSAEHITQLYRIYTEYAKLLDARLRYLRHKLDGILASTLDS